MDEFETLLRDQWWQLRTPTDPFAAAFSFLPAMPRDEAVAALRNRARLLRAASASMAASLESDWIRTSKPVHVAWLFELWQSRADAEATWCDRIAERVESGIPYLPEGLAGQGWAVVDDARRPSNGTDETDEK
ncbi:hypothetical protein [Micromonospora zhanjiangensis]